MNRYGIAVVILGLAVTTVFAQRPQRRYDSRALTVEESRARGMSEVIRAQGQANLNNARAAGQWEEARSRELDNRLKTTETFFEMREVNRSHRFDTDERAARTKQNQQARMESAARRGDPNELSYRQLDPVTGEISWPFHLTNPIFDDYRQRLEELFAERAKLGGQASWDTVNQINQTCDDFLEALRGEIRNIPTQQYMEARQFINALAHQVVNG